MVGTYGLAWTKRAHPADDLLSALIDARDAGDGLSERELLAMLFLLLVAGHETTVNLIGSGTLALLLSPGELARLRADSSLLPGAMEELLRYTSPATRHVALYRRGGEVGGTLIPAREACWSRSPPRTAILAATLPPTGSTSAGTGW